MNSQEFKQWRIAMGYTNQQLAADALGLSKSTIETYETGRRRDTGQDVVIPKVVALACAALRLKRGDTSSLEDRIQRWHQSGESKFLELVRSQKCDPQLEKRYFQFTYDIGHQEAQALDWGELVPTLREINEEIDEAIRVPRRSMFYIFTRREIAPYTFVDPSSGKGDEDFLECAVLGESVTGASDFWRISPEGLATLVRGYFEDREDTAAHLKTIPGTFLSPNWLVRDLAEFVRHARAYSRRFSDATAITFRCAWHGLDSRILHDPMALWTDDFYRFSDNAGYRVSNGTWAVSDIKSNWPEIVSALASPVMRAAQCAHIITPDWVRGEQNRWQRI